MDQSLVINEIFPSIQGEAAHAGVPCCFVRLAYCPLRCRFCDTDYAYNDGKSRLFKDILHEIELIGLQVIQIKGGEPLYQKNVILFINLLIDKGYSVLLETSGVLSLKEVPSKVHIIMHLKCPGSDME
ncbi:MAG: radical SAM protein [Oligoflexales bacterium]|nr:radical SAM protein [Oligoflexales bacterium]